MKSITSYISETNEEKVMAEVHYYDAKGRTYRLELLADELKKLGIEVNGTGFESDYDGYVEVMITREQAKMLDKSKYGKRLHIIGGGRYSKTIDDEFDNALKIAKMWN